jgi:uncharacterized protein (DUF169 family)
MDYKQLSDQLQTILEMKTAPVGIKFLTEGDTLVGYDSTKKYSICQFIMKAREGNKLLADAGNIACANGGSALGFLPVPEKLMNGEFLSQLGAFCKEGAKNTMELIPRFRQNQFSAIAFAPLLKVDFEPDVVLLETLPEQIMWVSLAAIYQNGGRHEFSTSISNGTCIDIIATPHSTHKLNTSLGCYGCRNATDIPTDHMLAGFPGDQLEGILEALEHIKEKTMPRSREKKAYTKLKIED